MELMLDGDPLPKGRPRFNTKTGHAYTPARTRQYENEVRGALMEAVSRIRSRGDQWSTSASGYEVSIAFYMRNPLFADSLNLGKAVEDAAIGVLWDDDDVVDYEYGIRRRHDPVNPRIEMEVRVTGQERKR